MWESALSNPVETLGSPAMATLLGKQPGEEGPGEIGGRQEVAKSEGDMSLQGRSLLSLLGNQGVTNG